MEQHYDPMAQIMGMMQMLNQRKQLRQGDRNLDLHERQQNMMNDRYGQEQELHKNTALLHSLSGLLPQQQMIPDGDKASFFKMLQERFGLPADYGQSMGVNPDIEAIQQMQQNGVKF